MSSPLRVAVNGIEIEYQTAGGGGRPFVLVHGFSGSRDDWSEVIPDLAKEHRVVALDQRGHGGTTNTGDPSTYTLARLVSDLEVFLDAIGVGEIDLLGHSMGGMVTMRFALANPSRVRSLVLMDTAPGPSGLIPKAVVEVGAKIAREQGMGALVKLFRARGETDPNLPPSSRRRMEAVGKEAYFASNERKLMAMDPEAFATLVLTLVEHEDVLDRLPQIGCPTTVLVGAEDQPFLVPSEKMAAAIPGAHHVVIPDAAHSPQVENRSAWLTAIRAHLARARG